ncbi:MAG TPA: recombinase family protein [Solirubrobacteraceae bacterium]|nr:recombinase family protein [Solirubrobacteraceae bacterium]
MRAALLLRVSSPSQVKTDYDPEGLSLPAQREAATRKAHSLDAEIVREYIEPGFSGGFIHKRKVFRQMIADIRDKQDIDYVIVWSVSRWARNQEDHWVARGMINRAGATLISVKEPIGGDGSHGIVVEGVMAAVAAGRRIEISEEASRGIKRKVEVGGFPGYAPLGYVNKGEPLPGGGEVRIIVVDRQRAPLIAWAFETYATGLYSLADMETLLAARGLRSRGNSRYAPRPLSQGRIHELLSNAAYAGKVPHKGKVYPGRHEKIIDEELFEQVQAVLKAHNAAGERDRKHQHYLKGSLRCGYCEQRLTYSRNKGNGGTYEYFVCAPGMKGDCQGGYRRAETIAGLIEDEYRRITLRADEHERVAALIEQRLASLADTSQQELDRCDGVLAGLKEQEKKLLAKHYQDDVSDELFHEEAERIKAERADAQGIIDRLSLRHDELQGFISLTLKLVSYDLHDLYLRASPSIRRLMNQALFETVWVEADDEPVIYTRSQLAQPFADVVSLRDELARMEAQPHETAADPLTGSAAWVVGSIRNEMVGAAGSGWLSRAVFGLAAVSRWSPAHVRPTLFDKVP